MKKANDQHHSLLMHHAYPYKGGIATDYEMHVSGISAGTVNSKITPMTFRNDRLRSIFLNHQNSNASNNNNNNNNNNYNTSNQNGGIGVGGSNANSHMQSKQHMNNAHQLSQTSQQQHNSVNVGSIGGQSESKIIKIPILHSSKNFRQLYNLSFKSQNSKAPEEMTLQAQNSIQRQSIHSSNERLRTSISPKLRIQQHQQSPPAGVPKTAQSHSRRRTEHFVPNKAQIKLFSEINQETSQRNHNSISTRQTSLKQALIGGNGIFSNSNNQRGGVSSNYIGGLSNAASNYIANNIIPPSLDSRANNQLIQSTFTHSKVKTPKIKFHSQQYNQGQIKHSSLPRPQTSNRDSQRKQRLRVPSSQLINKMNNANIPNLVMNKIMDFLTSQQVSQAPLSMTANNTINHTDNNRSGQKRASTAATLQSSRPDSENWGNPKRLSTEEIEMIKKRNKNFLDGLYFDQINHFQPQQSQNQPDKTLEPQTQITSALTSLKPDEKNIEGKLIRLQQQQNNKTIVPNHQNVLIRTQFENKMMRKKRDFQISKKVNTGRQSSERLNSPTSFNNNHLRSNSINSHYNNSIGNSTHKKKQQRVKLVFVDEEEAANLQHMNDQFYQGFRANLASEDGGKSSSIIARRKEVNDYLEYESKLGRASSKRIKLNFNYKKLQDKEYPQILKLLKEDISLREDQDRKIIQLDMNIQGNEYNTQDARQIQALSLNQQQSYYSNSYQEISLLGGESQHNLISSKHIHDSSEIVLENPEIIRGSFQFENHQIKAIKDPQQYSHDQQFGAIGSGYGSSVVSSLNHRSKNNNSKNSNYFPNFIEENAIHIYRNSKEIQTSNNPK